MRRCAAIAVLVGVLLSSLAGPGSSAQEAEPVRWPRWSVNRLSLQGPGARIEALAPGTVYEESEMGTYGTADGLVLVVPSAGEPGKLMGLLDGELQAYFDSDGKIKWAAGKGVADATGIQYVEDANNYWKIVPGGDQMLEVLADGTYSKGAYIRTRGAAAYAVHAVAEGNNSRAVLGEASGSSSRGVYGSASGELGVGVTAVAGGDATTALEIIGGIVDGGGQRFTNAGAASAGTDLITRDDGDARYAAIAGAHAAVTLAADAQEVLNLSTQEIGLVAQTANQVLAGPTSGAAADPDFRALVAADLPTATDSAQGAAELATVGEAATGTDTGRTVTPAGLPLRVVGGGWALKQPAGSAPGGNDRGTGAVDLQFVRAAVTQVASGVGAYLAGDSNTASGKYSSVVGGYSAVADKYGQQAHAAGSFTAAGDAQRSVYVLRKATTDATPAVLLLNPYPFAPVYLTIADDTAWNFRAEIVAITADAAGYAAYTVTGLVRRANGTVTVHGVTTVTITESAAAWDATAVADDTNKALSIQVTGAAGTTIRWVCTVYTSEVSFSS